MENKEENVKKTESEENNDVAKAFCESHDLGLDPDEIKMEMVKAGATFGNVVRKYNAMMISQGYVKSKEEEDCIVNDILSSVDPSTADGYEESIDTLISEFGIKEKKALSMIREWCKKKNMKFYEKPKGLGASSATMAIYGWIEQNITSKESEFIDFIKESGTEGNVKNQNAYIAVFRLCKRVYEKKVEE